MLIYGIGINNANYNVSKVNCLGNKIICPFYRKWRNMIQRCYDKKFQIKNPTYIGCTICNEWKYFMSFKKWMENQDHEGLQLDKDIINPGNKIYSPKNCCFVSREINSLLSEGNLVIGKYPKGVSVKLSGRFYSQISIDRKLKHLGCYNSVELAELAYVSVKREYIISKTIGLSDRIKQGLLRHADLLEDKAQELMKSAFL